MTSVVSSGVSRLVVGVAGLSIASVWFLLSALATLAAVIYSIFLNHAPHTLLAETLPRSLIWPKGRTGSGPSSHIFPNLQIPSLKLQPPTPINETQPFPDFKLFGRESIHSPNSVIKPLAFKPTPPPILLNNSFPGSHSPARPPLRVSFSSESNRDFLHPRRDIEKQASLDDIPSFLERTPRERSSTSSIEVKSRRSKNSKTSVPLRTNPYEAPYFFPKPEAIERESCKSPLKRLPFDVSSIQKDIDTAAKIVDHKMTYQIRLPDLDRNSTPSPRPSQPAPTPENTTISINDTSVDQPVSLQETQSPHSTKTALLEFSTIVAETHASKVKRESLPSIAEVAMDSRTGSPNSPMKIRTPKPPTPRPPPSEGASSAGRQQRSPEAGRTLNVTDALSYLDAVKVQFQDKPDVYNHFLDIMKDFKSQDIDTSVVIERVSILFHGNPYLIQGFNTFLPVGYRIEVSADPSDPNMITVTTPMGTRTQSTYGRYPRTRSETAQSGATHPLAYPGEPGPNGSGSRSQTPHNFSTTHEQSHYNANFSSPGYSGSTTAAAASFLGNLNNRGPIEKQPAAEFNHAIQYLNKIKARYSDDTVTYKQFLEILQTYQKEQRHFQDSQVYFHVQALFKDAPDLLAEFKDFLPEIGLGGPSFGGSTPQPMPGPSASASRGQDPMSLDKVAKKQIPALKRRKRPTEKDTTPIPPPKAASTRSKKPKHHHREDSPPYSPYQEPNSPQPQPNHSHLPPPPPPPPSHLSRPPVSQSFGHSASSESEFLFFERAKRMLENRETYDEFLKLLSLYSKEIVDLKTLLDGSKAFLGNGELMAEFKELMGWDERLNSVEFGPPGSIRTGPPEALAALPTDDGGGPSYRRLPDSEIRLACSGRDELFRSVLNDEWVSHPTWASEEAGFVAHKKNSFEEVLHKSEEERHEYHLQIEALTRTISVLEPLAARLEDMSNDERALFKLRPDFGGPSKCLYHRMIKKVYGRDAGLEVIQAMQDCPSVAVPVVLARLKQKDEEWRRSQREWGRTWRELDAKNFYKSLDHQGINFKTNDKKYITAKHFVTDIETVKADQTRVLEQQGRTYAFPGHQLELVFEDTSVLHDSLKMVYSFLDHSQAVYGSHERRSVEKFLRSFIPLLCMYPSSEFNAACGPVESAQDDEAGEQSGRTEGQKSGRRSAAGAHSVGGVPANDLRKKLLKTAQGGGRHSRNESRSGSPSGKQSPTPGSEMTNGEPPKRPDDVWIREAGRVSSTRAPEPARRRPFFANTTFYTLLRLLELLYSRLSACKQVGAAMAANKHSSLYANPVAVELGLDDPNGPTAVFQQVTEAFGSEGNVLYMYLLDACEKMFDSEMDPVTFEEQMRWFFGSKAYYVFTLDKVITALVKQVQTIISDNKSQELWTLLQQARSTETTSNQDVIRYRREAEQQVGADDPLFRMDWTQKKKTLFVRALSGEDPSNNDGSSAETRWGEYVDSYVMTYSTEWAPRGWQGSRRTPLLLKRNLNLDDQRWNCQGDLSIRISLGTYKMFYERGSGEALWRTRGRDEEKELAERAKTVNERRRRCHMMV